MRATFFLSAILGSVCLAVCQANPIVQFESQIGGTYDYSLVVTSVAVSIPNNNDIVLSGLSGVTGASVTGALGSCFTLEGFTSTSVTIQNQTGSQCFEFGAYPNLAVTSTVTTPGTVNFEIDIASGPVYGTTTGPAAAATPEPASGALLCLGIAAMGVGRLRRRIVARN